MAVQGATINLRNIDLSIWGTLDNVVFEIYKGESRDTILKFRYPAATGYQTATKVGDVYSLKILPTDSINMQGLYSIEITGTVDAQNVNITDNKNGKYFNVNPSAR